MFHENANYFILKLWLSVKLNLHIKSTLKMRSNLLGKSWNMTLAPILQWPLESFSLNSDFLILQNKIGYILHWKQPNLLPLIKKPHPFYLTGDNTVHVIS